MKRKLPCFGEGEGLQIVDETREQSRFIQCRVDVLGRRLIDPVEDALEVALNDMERRAQFVGNVCGEVAALLFGAFEFADHFVETLDQVAEHIRVVFRHTRREIAFFDSIDGIEKFFEWFAEADIEIEDGEEKDGDQNNWRAADEDPNISDVGILRKEEVEKCGNAAHEKNGREDEKDDERNKTI